MTAVVQTDSLSRWYGQVIGVNDLSVEVGPGITGLLGPNGSGKTTLLGLVTGQLRPQRGGIRVLGEKPFANRRLYRRMGYCPEQDALYGNLTGREFVTFLMRLHGAGASRARAAAETALELVGLQDVMDRRCGTYSRGMRQRVKLAQALAHEPELLVLDEPFTGMDPEVRRRMRDLMRTLRAGGTCILVSSHVLHEVEALADSVVLIHRGRILADGPVQEIRGLLRRHPHRLSVQLRDPRALARGLMDRPEVRGLHFGKDGETLVVETGDPESLLAALPGIVTETRPGLRVLRHEDAGLEAVFDYLVR